MRERRSLGRSRPIYLLGGMLLVGLAAYFLIPAVGTALEGHASGTTEVTVFLALIGLGLLACGVVSLLVAGGWEPAGGRGIPGRGAMAFTVLGAAGGVYWLLALPDRLGAQPPLAVGVMVVFFALAGGMWGAVLGGVYGALRNGPTVEPPAPVEAPEAD